MCGGASRPVTSPRGPLWGRSGQTSPLRISRGYFLGTLLTYGGASRPVTSPSGQLWGTPGQTSPLRISLRYFVGHITYIWWSQPSCDQPKWAARGYTRVGHPFFSKERNGFAFFSVLYKRTEQFLHSFPFFIKEWNDLCVLFRSL